MTDFRQKEKKTDKKDRTSASVVEIIHSPDAYAERLSLCRERLATMRDLPAQPAAAAYFRRLTDLAQLVLQEYDEKTRRADATVNAALYYDVMPEHYAESYADPACAEKRLGSGYGPLLSAWYAEFRGMIPYAYEQNTKHLAVMLETFIQLYNAFEEAAEEQTRAVPADGMTQEGQAESAPFPPLRVLQDIVYSYLYDYCEEFTEDFYAAGLGEASAGNELVHDILAHADLKDQSEHSWLYRYGEWITEAERETAELLAGFSEEKLQRMADAYTEGYLKGFSRAGKDVSKKKTVLCYLPIGFERFMKKAVRNFEEAGLSVIFQRNPVHLTDRGLAGNVKPGFYGAQNPQYEYDHREDLALFMGDRLKAEKINAIQKAFRKFGEEAAALSGNACVEVFGTDGFVPAEKPERLRFTARQNKLCLLIRSAKNETAEQYMPEAETSFTIIAWPRPAIAEGITFGPGKEPGPGREEGQDPDQKPGTFHSAYAALFEEFIRINTLPEERYRLIQQALCDALDGAEHVEITGRGRNRTRLRVSLHPLRDPAAETNFENCLADVNIPVGEVFTSPQLCGTEGELFVSSVYLSGYCFRDLFIRFENGRVADYGCGGLSEEEGRRLMETLIFKGQSGLPMGEFAIGTNTTAYAAAKKWGIEAKMPVLIAEKTGPHFAVGDTCYAHEEDVMTYNPDGKAITARSNECSDLRKTEPDKAYFHTHVDITIPYDEIGGICAVHADGTAVALLRDGRFVLPGTEELNEPLAHLREQERTEEEDQ